MPHLCGVGHSFLPCRRQYCHELLERLERCAQLQGRQHILGVQEADMFQYRRQWWVVIGIEPGPRHAALVVIHGHPLQTFCIFTAHTEIGTYFFSCCHNLQRDTCGNAPFIKVCVCNWNAKLVLQVSLPPSWLADTHNILHVEQTVSNFRLTIVHGTKELHLLLFLFRVYFLITIIVAFCLLVLPFVTYSLMYYFLVILKSHLLHFLDVCISLPLKGQSELAVHQDVFFFASNMLYDTFQFGKINL